MKKTAFVLLTVCLLVGTVGCRQVPTPPTDSQPHSSVSTVETTTKESTVTASSTEKTTTGTEATTRTTTDTPSTTGTRSTTRRYSGSPNSSTTKTGTHTTTTTTASLATTATRTTTGKISRKTTTTTGKKPYEQLICREITFTEEQQFVFGNRESSLSLSIPAEWRFVKRTGEYTIERDGIAIGSVSTKTDTTGITQENNNFSDDTDTHRVDYTVYHQNGNYRRRVTYTDKRNNHSVCVDVLYTEISDALLSEWYFNFMLFNFPAHEDVRFPSATLTNPSKKILILGNSFVSTSQIGMFLQQMLDAGGTGFTVDAVSVGMANVSTFTEDESIMQLVRSGDYAALFQCGLFNANYVDHMAQMQEACKQGNTLFMAFPAHNERQSGIDALQKKYPTVPVLDWKNEIDHFISAGVPRSRLCIDDGHQHTTPLGGYIGAQLIYHTLFGIHPPEIQNGYMTEVNHWLGSYPSTGNIALADSGFVHVLE